MAALPGGATERVETRKSVHEGREVMNPGQARLLCKTLNEKGIQMGRRDGQLLHNGTAKQIKLLNVSIRSINTFSFN